MNLKILLASFSLVFLAELGDKTQLTALAFSTSSRSPFSVFIGTSLALICTTALAVIFGEALTRFVPERVLQLASAVMFVLVGLVLLVNLARQGPAESAPGERVPEGAALRPAGPLSLFIGRQAVAFEEDLVAYIRETAPKIEDPSLRDIVLSLETVHSGHAKALSGLEKETDEATIASMDADLAGGDHQRLLYGLDAASSEVAGDALSHIIQRQEAAAQFYIALARMINFHEGKDVLRSLAQEEIDLAQTLCDHINHPRTRDNEASRPADSA